MNLDTYIKYLTKLRDENNAGDFQVAKYEIFEKKDCYEGRAKPLRKYDIELYKEEKVIVINTDFHQKSN